MENLSTIPIATAATLPPKAPETFQKKKPLISKRDVIISLATGAAAGGSYSFSHGSTKSKIIKSFLVGLLAQLGLEKLWKKEAPLEQN